MKELVLFNSNLITKKLRSAKVKNYAHKAVAKQA